MTTAVFDRNMTVDAWKHAAALTKADIAELEQRIVEARKMLTMATIGQSIASNPPTARNVLWPQMVTKLDTHRANAAQLGYPYYVWNGNVMAILKDMPYNDFAIGTVEDYGL